MTRKLTQVIGDETSTSEMTPEEAAGMRIYCISILVVDIRDRSNIGSQVYSILTSYGPDNASMAAISLMEKQFPQYAAVDSIVFDFTEDARKFAADFPGDSIGGVVGGLQ